GTVRPYPLPPAPPRTEPLRTDAPPGTGRKRRFGSRNGETRPGLRSVGPAVLHGLQANAAHRAHSGFLIFFLAVLLREQPLSGQS
ncbi:MFS transporter, partial [Streptomyces sp. DT9]